jgi:ribosomal protein S18 acetylase RimI-like enzyme
VETGRRAPAAPPLLVRWAAAACERHVVALLRDVPVDPQEVAGLVRQRAVLVLSDVTLPRSAPPVATAAFRFDRPAKTAQLVGIGVAGPLRRRGLGRRLLTGALMVLRAEGFERVQAWAEPGGASAALLASAGFAAEGDAAQADGRVRFLLML